MRQDGGNQKRVAIMIDLCTFGRKNCLLTGRDKEKKGCCYKVILEKCKRWPGQERKETGTPARKQ